MKAEDLLTIMRDSCVKEYTVLAAWLVKNHRNVAEEYIAYRNEKKEAGE